MLILPHANAESLYNSIYWYSTGDHVVTKKKYTQYIWHRVHVVSIKSDEFILLCVISWKGDTTVYTGDHWKLKKNIP